MFPEPHQDPHRLDYGLFSKNPPALANICLRSVGEREPEIRRRRLRHGSATVVGSRRVALKERVVGRVRRHRVAQAVQVVSHSLKLGPRREALEEAAGIIGQRLDLHPDLSGKGAGANHDDAVEGTRDELFVQRVDAAVAEVLLFHKIDRLFFPATGDRQLGFGAELLEEMPGGLLKRGAVRLFGHAACINQLVEPQRSLSAPVARHLCVRGAK